MIDKSKLKELALAAEKDGQHIYMNPRDSNEWRANSLWHEAASPEAFLELLAELESVRGVLKQAAGYIPDIGFQDTISTALATTTSTEPKGDGITDDTEAIQRLNEPKGQDSHVMPPFAAPAGQHNAAIEALRPFAELAELFDPENRGANMPGKDSDPIMQWPRLHKEYELTVGHLRMARDVLASRGAAQGRITSDNGCASPAPSAKQEPSDHVESEKGALRRLAVQSMADCMDMVRQDLIDMGIIDKSVAPMFIPEAIANYIKRLAAPSASASTAAPMAETFANLLRIQRAEAETGDPYMVGLYNGMSMMCANIDGDLNWKPMEFAPAAPVAGSQHVPVEPTSEMLQAAHAAENCGHGNAHFRNAYAAMLAAAPAVPVPVEQEWISVEDRLPGQQGQDSEEVMCFLSGHCALDDMECRQGAGWGIRLGFYDAEKGMFRTHGRPDASVTHWMPLPAAPSLQQGKEAPATRSRASVFPDSFSQQRKEGSQP